jgi:hypothetical protein
MRVRLLLCVLLLQFGCGDDLSIGPQERGIAIQGTDAWSGGQYRVSVQFGADVEPPLRVILDGESLPVTRVDGVTFSAQLPTRVGDFPLRVEGDDLGPFAITLTLHGYRSGELGPAVGGAVVARAVNGGHVVLGSTLEGASEVSLATGQVVRTWPLAMHSVRCTGGMVPGPLEGQVIVRGALGAEEECEYYRARIYNSAGLSTVSSNGFASAQMGLSAIVGPLTMVLGSQDQAAQVGRCTTPGEPWSNCESLALNVYGSLVGYAAHHATQRILPLARGASLHNLTTGNVIAQLPVDEEQLYYKAAAFSRSGDTLYAAAAVGDLFGTNGKVFALAPGNGQVLDEISIADGVPLAVAVDDFGKQVLVVVANREEQVWLRVISRKNHELVIDIPLDNPLLASAIAGHYHHQLIMDAATRELTLVSTARVRSFQDTAIPPMVVARWSIATP